MGQQIGGTEGGGSNVSVLKSWLVGMGEAATDNNVSVLYCCAPPNVHMTGVTVPAAFAVRASPDYVWAPQNGKVLKLPTVQWALGPDNAFHWSGLGLLPYKDTFFSNASMTQHSGEWTNDTRYWPPFAGYHELNAQTHALMALLSMAQVTFGDAVGQSNRTLLMRLVREDGMVLKADRPATALDAQFQAMMFGGWPGSNNKPPHPPPGPPTPDHEHGALSTAPCSASGANQKWTVNTATGGLAHTADGGCVDIAGCGTGSGADVRLFYYKGWECGVGAPKVGSACSFKNEQWKVVPQKGAGASSIVSVLSGMCLRAESGGPATAVTCSTTDPHQSWVVVASASPAAASVNGTQTVTFKVAGSAAEVATCLTGAGPPKRTAAVQAEAWHGFDTHEELEAAVDARYPAGSSTISQGYKAAYTVSAEFMERSESRWQARVSAAHGAEGCGAESDKKEGHGGDAGGEQCPRGLGAPQGPVGEVYATHTTIGDFTWRYVIGVQLSNDFNVTTHDVGLGGDSSSESATYSWSDAHTFQPVLALEVELFSVERPLTLRASDVEQCHTGQGQMDVTTTCFPAQWHTIAPVLPNGCVLLGEVGKFIPVSRQRISSVTAAVGSSTTTVALRGVPPKDGKPGEQVTVGHVAAFGKHSDPVYKTVSIGEDGTATVSFSSE